MPDRLDDLRRQRALVQEQLARLDREIAAPTRPTGSPNASTPTPAVASPEVTAAFPEYQPDPVAAHREARRGCLLFAALGFLVLGAGVVAIYYFGYRDHPIFMADRPPAAAPSP